MFTAEENAGGAFVAVLSHGLWQRRWGGDPAIVGRVLNLNGSPFTVVGILPAGFRPPEALGQQGTDLWMPLSHVETTLKTQRFDTFLVGIGRLARQLLTESLMLGALGGVGGIGVAWVGVAAFVAFNPGDVPRLGEVSLDSTVLAFAVLTSLITSLAFGLAPAAATSRSDIVGR